MNERPVRLDYRIEPDKGKSGDDVFMRFTEQPRVMYERRMVCIKCGRWKIDRHKKLLWYKLRTKKSHKHVFRIKRISFPPIESLSQGGTDVGVSTSKVMIDIS